MRNGLIALVLLLASLHGGSVYATDDPLEGFNRAIYGFNNGADKYVVRPLAVGYEAVMPTPARMGVNNFFRNFIDVNAALNAFLQGRFEYGANNLGRVVVNTTLGFFGVFDVASHMEIPQYQTDFGHTLATWGVAQGPFIMLPFLGPSTVRATAGTVFDAYASPTGQIGGRDAQWGLRAVSLVDIRAGLLGADELLSGDQYIFLRDAYMQRRELLTNDGEILDDFSEFDEAWEGDDF
ncbi:VacJ family lipoprotein [Luminiphilus sp.]|jgi:phospholipid-binding lipoprotein MlaA|nr:VacJ family lipoprotein [Luminiphilus sp.]